MLRIRSQQSASEIKIMRNIHKKIQTISNVAIIIAALLLSGFLVKSYLLPASQKPSAVESEEIKVGTRIALPNVDWSKSDKNLVLALSTSCHFCSESAPFYQKLAQLKAGRGDVRLIAALPQTVTEAQAYLSEHNLLVDEVRQTSLDTIDVRGTPTLVLVDRNGTVVDSWKGKLPPEKETEVANRLFGENSDG